jgi:hypothetical protein
MANKQTKKCNYPSRYSPEGFVTATQYIIELVCEQSAIKQKKDLPIKFWNLPEWNKIFKGQLIAVLALLKKYSAKAIIKAVKEKKLDNLRPKWVEPIIEQEQILLSTIKTKENVSEEVRQVREQEVVLPKPREVKSKLWKLDLDNYVYSTKVSG